MNINYIRLCALTFVFNTAISTSAQAVINGIDNSTISVQQAETQKLIADTSNAKNMLRAKLANLAHFTASFSQEVESVSGDKIAQSAGKLAISKPNLANWHTTEPDELAIVSDGNNVWFYDPWIEQVSVYSLSAAIAKTPILLLTSQDEALWQQYTVVKELETDEAIERFVIMSKDVNSQIKSLTLMFDLSNGKSNLKQFSFLDATGQVSHITLTNFEDETIPEASLFQFNVPQGVQIDDQRSE
tara:strand:+ start:470 stop:1201 length:732 start_codon:yes stop_codon:yes gene_type:complete